MEEKYEKHNKNLQKLLYDGLVGDSDPDIPNDEYSPEAKLLLEWLFECKNQGQIVSSVEIGDKLAEIFTKMFGDPYKPTEFKAIADLIKTNIKA